MRYLTLILAAAVLCGSPALAAECSPTGICRACKNCHACKWCHKLHHLCSVCRKEHQRAMAIARSRQHHRA